MSEKRKSPPSRRQTYGRRITDIPTMTAAGDSGAIARERREGRVDRRSGPFSQFVKEVKPSPDERRQHVMQRRSKDRHFELRAGRGAKPDKTIRKLERRKGQRRSDIRRGTDVGEALKSGRPMTIDIGKYGRLAKKAARKAGPLGAAIWGGVLGKEAKAFIRESSTTPKDYKGGKGILPKKPKVK